MSKLSQKHSKTTRSRHRVKDALEDNFAEVLNGQHQLILKKELLTFVSHVNNALPLEIIELERNGVSPSFLVNLAKEMDVSSTRLFEILRLPKSTASRKISNNSLIDGQPGQSAVAMIKLLCQANEILQNSTANEAKDFDLMKWFGRWIEVPQPALAGCKPAELMDTPTGVATVSRLLGSIESGAYQ